MFHLAKDHDADIKCFVCKQRDHVALCKLQGVCRNLRSKISKTKTSKAKTPEYLLDESFVFVFFATVQLSCQCGMSKKC